MTEPGGPGEERPLSAEEELSVARALREMPPPPVPPALAARLDARLAELQSERAGAATDDAGRASGARTRRRWPQLLVAAAVVLVGGYAVGTALEGSPGVSGSASSGSAAEQASGSAPGSHPTPRGPDTGHPVPDLHRATLRGDVRRLLRSAPPGAGVEPGRAGNGVAGGPDAKTPGGISAGWCRAPAPVAGATVWAVRYDGARAFLVTHPVGAGRVLARLYSCADPGSPTDAPLRTLPQPVPSVTLTVRAP